MNVPITNTKGSQKRHSQDSQNLSNDTFHRAPVTSAQCIISTKKYPDFGILLNYNDDDYSKGYGPRKEAFKALTKDDILQPYISDNDFRSSNGGNDIGNNLYVFDIKYQKNFESAQPIKIEFKISENVTAGIYGYALVLTNRILSISSDSQRMFDLI